MSSPSDDDEKDDDVSVFVWADAPEDPASITYAVPAVSTPPLLSLMTEADGVALLGATVAFHFTRDVNAEYDRSEFHSLFEPLCPLPTYLARLVTFSTASLESVVIAVALIVRLESYGIVSIDRLSIHRLVMASLRLATKWHDDTYIDNAAFAKIAGLSLSDVNDLERALWEYLRASVQCTTDEYDAYVVHLFDTNPLRMRIWSVDANARYLAARKLPVVAAAVAPASPIHEHACG